MFLHYQRIINPIYRNQTIVVPSMESDIESFIIRQRIILNDIAYIIRQLLPKESRGLKNPRGKTHPLNKEMRIKEIIDYVEQNKTNFKELYEILEKNKNWILKMREQRDGIVHYKSKVILLEDELNVSFIILDAAGTLEFESMNNGERRIISTPVFEFINTQTKSLWNFLNADLKKWLEEYIKDKNMKYIEISKGSEIICAGVSLFREINKIR
mgnify:CR=1 FL=1